MSFTQMEEDLTCPVCLELFADPLMMPCSHSVCKACLVDIRKSRAKADKQDLECPTCRTSHKLKRNQIESLPKNLALENIVFRYQEIQSLNMSKGSLSLSQGVSPDAPDIEAVDDVFAEAGEPDDCGMCEESSKAQADWFCRQCQVHYCKGCLDIYHPRKGSLRRHQVCRSSLQGHARPQLRCPAHPEEKAHIFCDACKSVACHLCVCQGQGSHCGHVILDVTSAHQQLQDVLKRAKEELSNLATTLEEKDCTLASQLSDLKALQASATSLISHQHSSLLADLTWALDTVRRGALHATELIVQRHMASLTSQSASLHSTLAQCQDLISACESLDQGEEKYVRPHSRGPSKEATTNHDHSFCSSLDESFDSTDTTIQASSPVSCVILKGDGIKTLRHTLSEPEDINTESKKTVEGAGVSNQDIEVTDGGGDECPGASNFKRGDNLARSLRVQSTPSPRLLSPRETKSNSPPLVEKLKVKVGDKLSVKTDFTRKEEGTKQKNNLTRKANVEDQLKETHRHMNVLLQRAEEVGPIIEQATELCKESPFTDICDTYQDKTSDSIRKDVASGIAGFYQQALSTVATVAAMATSQCTPITPAVRSAASPALSATQSLSATSPTGRRPQSRTLITWGFNSTTFSADPVGVHAQWRVVLHRNTSHIGDVRTGYLFGVGVSHKGLGSKEQLGLGSDSWGVVCSAGQLTFCHAGHMDPLAPLADLPLTVTLSVLPAAEGCILHYRISQSNSLADLRGGRVIPQAEGCGMGGQEVCPVFTVSQRVKMQLPLASDM